MPSVKPVSIKEYAPVQQEPEILKYWVKEETYEKAKAMAKKGQDFYFLDGPPYTSGKVHIGTAWNKALKDMVLRYKRMQGFNVWDRAGYDMHGLPTEHATEKKLGIKGKEAIERFGIQKFIEECRQLAVDNMLVMNQDFERLGVWMDFDNAYQSVSREFIEGVWWLIKKAHENNRLYEGMRTMTWCANCATVAAKHELEYEDVNEPSIFVKFAVLGEEKTYLIIWTTTPWTIPFNLAVMVHPGLDYVKCDVDGERWIVAKALAAPLIRMVAGKQFTLIEEFKGSKLEGVRYQHPQAKEIAYFNELRDNLKVHSVILSEEYVSTDAGSGLVHCAPGCGPEDYEVGHRNGIPAFNHLNEKGVVENLGMFTGWRAKIDDKKFIDALRDVGALVAVTNVAHSYPHCQRCHLPVIFRTTQQWFFRVEDLKDEMIRENNKIRWVPDAAYNAFNSWLENLRDNSITKQRYWGTPLPVWKCGSCSNYIVIGSVKDLAREGGDVPKDLHKPWIDEVTIKCECGGVKRRVPDIIDVWVDAGSASWNCLDYPKTDKHFRKLFPAEFILEGKDQIRGWFNLLLVASMVALKQPSFRKVYMHGFVQDALGRKMSKSLGNYILPEEVISQYGADTLRYYTLGGAQPAVDLNYNFDDMKMKNRNLNVLWNLHKLIIDNAVQLSINPAMIKKKDVESFLRVEENYILSLMNTTIKEATGLFNAYLLNEIPWKAEKLLLELSRTYIQLVREKLAAGDEGEKSAVLYTATRVLMETLKLFAPVVPFITESIYLNLREAFSLKEKSIHHLPWPKVVESEINAELESAMEVGKNIMQAILSCREKLKLGVRWPLKHVAVASTDATVQHSARVLRDAILVQTNVKGMDVVDKVETAREKVKADFAKLQPDFGDRAAVIIAKMAMESPEAILSHIEKNGFHDVNLGAEKVKIERRHLIIEPQAPTNYEAASFPGGMVYVNKERTKELDGEGYAREIMRKVQSLRKKAGMEKQDRIELYLQAEREGCEYLAPWHDAIKEKVGASTLVVSQVEVEQPFTHKDVLMVKGLEFTIGMEKV